MDPIDLIVRLQCNEAKDRLSIRKAFAIVDTLSSAVAPAHAHPEWLIGFMNGPIGWPHSESLAFGFKAQGYFQLICVNRRAASRFLGFRRGRNNFIDSQT
ncbi:MAG TPA: hypothetical protein VGG12_02480 [Methylovirgula sp.]